jgi:hypothetical protein
MLTCSTLSVTLLNFAVAALVNDDDAEVDYNAWSGVEAMSNPDVLTGYVYCLLNRIISDSTVLHRV